MRTIAALLLLSAACGGDDVELYPVNPGGGGPSSGGTFGSGSNGGDGDAGVEITGRVCVITDARTPTTGCADTGVAGLTVMLGTRTATTMANGDFTIRVVTGTSNVWRVSGTGIVPSAMTFTSTNIIPALATQTFSDMTSTNSAAFPGTGSIIAKVSQNGTALVNATATAAPAPARGTLYDAADEITWNQTSTGGLGAVWIAGITPTATETMTVTTAANASTSFMNIPVFADTITWLFASVP